MRAAVLGSPIAHSLSPALHRAAYTALGLDDWSYEAIECDEAGLPALVAGCGPQWAGLSLTMPLKRAVLPLLDEAEPLVGEVGAANTVVFDGGRRLGRNTDVPGMIAAFAEAGLTSLDAPGAEPTLARGGPGAGGALILGGGATACSALAAVRGLGAREARVAVRDRSRAGDVLAAAERLGMQVALVPFDSAQAGGPGVWPAPAGSREAGEAALTAQPALLISTVPAGAADSYAQLLTEGVLRPRWVFDVVYHPWPTSLAVAAGKAGAPLIGGFDLLLHQAAGQVSLMTGRPAPLEAMRTAGLAALHP